MIIKAYELNKINLKKNNIYLLYGENEGLKNKVINDIFKEFLKNNYKYDEKEVLINKENFFNNILTKSFFETKKIIIILRSSDKIVNIVEEVLEKITEDTKIIFISSIFFSIISSIIFLILSLTLEIIINFSFSKKDFDWILSKKDSKLSKISFSSYL